MNQKLPQATNGKKFERKGKTSIKILNKLLKIKIMQKEKGIVAIIIAIVVVTAVLGTGGYLIYKNYSQPKLIGGDKDSHGCLIAAGYSWCEPKQKCLRTWEEKCEANSSSSSSYADPTAGWKTYTNSQYGFSIKYNQNLETSKVLNNESGEMVLLIQKPVAQAPVMQLSWYNITVKEGISSLDELKNFYPQTSVVKTGTLTTKDITFLDLSALDMDYAAIPAYDHYVHAVGVVKNNTAYIISYWDSDDKNTFGSEFSKMLSTFKFTR